MFAWLSGLSVTFITSSRAPVELGDSSYGSTVYKFIKSMLRDSFGFMVES